MHRLVEPEYYKIDREWDYKNIPPRIIVEDSIDDGSGAAPNDYKLSVFGGTGRVHVVHAGRLPTIGLQHYTRLAEARCYR